MIEHAQSTPQARILPGVTVGGSVFPSRIHIGVAVVLGAVLLIGLAPRLDTDLWWHLKDGGYIWTHATIPSHDFYSFTFGGHVWTDHEWLTELLLFGLYSAAGLWGPICLFAAIICLTYGVVYLRMARLGINPFLALFVLVLSCVAASPTWGARPQMLSLLFLAVYAYVLDRFVRSRSRRLLIVLPVLMLVWTNTHGGWILGLTLIAITLAGETVNHWRRHELALSATDLKALGIVLLVTLAATFVNPYGAQQVFYPLVWLFPSAYSNVLNEWVSSDFHQPIVMVFEFMLLSLVVTMYVGRSRINWTHLLLILAFTHLALSQSRNVAVWSVVISPLLAFYLHRALAGEGRELPGSHRQSSLSRRAERLVNLSLLCIVVAMYSLVGVRFANAQALRSYETTVFPSGAVTYMQHHRLPPHTFAGYAWGGYLLWRGWPHYQDFIDGRANTLFDARILADYLGAYQAAERWSQILDKRHVENVLVDPQAPLAQLLAHNHKWRLAYRDVVSVLYTRR